MNKEPTCANVGTNLTQPRSRVVRGQVYFIRAGDFIKIGFSTRPLDRLSSLQTSHPDKLEIVGTRPGSRAFEAELHERFKDLRVRGEWFHAKAPLLRYIEHSTMEGIARGRRSRDLRSVELPAPSRKRGDPATIAWLIALRVRFGSQTPIGYRCSNMAELEDNLANAIDENHASTLRALRAKQGRGLMQLLAAAA